MAAPDGYIYCTGVTFSSSYAYTASANNPLSFRLQAQAQETTEHVGANPEAVLAAVHSVVRRVFVRMRYAASIPPTGTKETLEIEQSDGDGNTRTYSYGTMRFKSATRNTTGRAQLGEVELEFVHESADGTTDPETITDA
jgi:hypothetical protein